MESLDQLELLIDVVGFVLVAASDLDCDPLTLMRMGKVTRWVIWRERLSEV